MCIEGWNNCCPVGEAVSKTDVNEELGAETLLAQPPEEQKRHLRNSTGYISSGPEIAWTSFTERLSFLLCSKPQLVMFMMFHLMASLVVYLHFFSRKWCDLEQVLPRKASNYWQKHTVPPLEFGAMHSLLYQMIMLPLCMCRNLLTYARGTCFNRYLPLDDIISVHKFLGYLMTGQVLVAFLLFVGHFGTLCSWYKSGNEKVDGCAKFTDEIMVTGYVILGLVLVICVTSAFRRKLPYEVFKYVHYLFIPLYGITILHTLDSKGRKGADERSQTWVWLAWPMVLYAADYVWGVLRYKRSIVLEAEVYSEGLVLRLQRPPAFVFRSGQYVRINVPEVSWHEWHPYSISSSPDETEFVELYISTHPGGWTERLRGAVLRDGSGACKSLSVFMDGPHGSTFQNATHHRYLLLVASGTGIAPILALVRHIFHSSRVVEESPEETELQTGASPLQDREGMDSKPCPGPVASVRSGTTVFSAIKGNDDLRGRERHLKIVQYCQSVQQDLMYGQAVRYHFAYAFFVFCAAVDLFLQGISFSVYSLKVEYEWAYRGISCLTTLIVAVRVVNVVFWRVQQSIHDRKVLRSTDSRADAWVLEAPLFALMVYLNYESYKSFSRPSLEHLIASAMMGLYRILWTLANTPLLLQLPGGTRSESTSTVFVRRLSLFWACRPSALMLIGPSLADAVQRLRLRNGRSYLQPYIAVKDASSAEREQVAALLRGTALEGCVHFSEGTGDLIVNDICGSMLGGTDFQGSVGIYYCGAPQLAVQLRRSVMAFRARFSERSFPLVFGS